MERLGEVSLRFLNIGNQLDKAVLQRLCRCLEAGAPGRLFSELLEPVS